MDELSDTKIRNAAPADKEYALADGRGLSVVVRPNGTKLWLYRCRFGGKRKNMSFGTFPRWTEGGAQQAPRRRKAARRRCLLSLFPGMVMEAREIPSLVEAELDRTI